MIRKAIIVVLALCSLATAAVWTESHRMHKESGRWYRKLDIGDTRLAFGMGRRTRAPESRTPGRATIHYAAPIRRHVNSTRLTTDLRYPGFRFSRYEYTAYRRDGAEFTGSMWTMTFPLWAASIIFAAYPALAFIRGPLRRWRRRRQGRCVPCGYDLTGNTSGTCPECGKPCGPLA